jgi:metallophosphoesterase (TIGR00282 family)
MLKLLFIGDVITPRAVSFLAKSLWSIRQREGVDFVAVNGENASFLGGISDEGAKALLSGGADCITGGNHTLQTRSIYRRLEEGKAVLRPLNYPDAAPGCGYTILPIGGARILVISALGTVYMEPGLADPLPLIERVLAREKGSYDLSFLDLHAEATGEKLTVARALDGRISAVIGTHTHVPTADEQILPRGTAYLSDVGMCGPSGGILGVAPEVMIERNRTHLRVPYAEASGPIVANAAVVELDESSGCAKAIRRLTFGEADL